MVRSYIDCLLYIQLTRHYCPYLNYTDTNRYKHCTKTESPNIAEDSYSRAIIYFYTNHISKFASAFRERVEDEVKKQKRVEDEVKSQETLPQKKSESGCCNTVGDDLLLWIKNAPVLEFREKNLASIKSANDVCASTWNIWVDRKTSATMFQVDEPNFMGGLYHEKYLFARICNGFTVKPLSKNTEINWFNRPNATSKVNPFHNLPSLYLHFGSRAKSNAEYSLSCEFLYMKVVEETAGSVAVTDGLTLKGYYIENRTKSTLKKERHRRLRNKISMAGIAFKRMKNVHPLSLVYDIHKTDQAYN